jgi:disulfide bond formation protein DsbB
MWKSPQFIERLEIGMSIFGIFTVLGILSAALVMQFVYGEMPCPLCELQRAAFLSIAIGLFMNIRYGNKVAHWAIVILSAFAGIAVSVRQILLHVNDPVGFGSAILGLHMYTWCLVGFVAVIVGATLMLIIYPELANIKQN